MFYSNLACPCGRPRVYAECCAPFHQGQSTPSTAEDLMRSRYSAYVLHLAPYLLETWDASTRPAAIEFDPLLRWIRLNVHGRKKGRAKDSEGWVSFCAYYELDAAQQGCLQEKSYFCRNTQGEWRYVSGEVA
ncbi:MAG: SEC-C domain-containing protein [Thiotrichales bacterium]|nr:SEC-C domain-containing protein [Thiotrichales bacterium]